MRRVSPGLVVGLLLGAVCAGGLSGSAFAAPRPTSQCGIAIACGTITVNLFGAPSSTGLDPGSGTVTSSPAGIDCAITDGTVSGTCSYEFQWPLGRTFDVSTSFASSPGSGVCFGDTSVCTAASDFSGESGGSEGPLTANTTTNETMTFAKELVALTVTKSGVGTGTVRGSPKPFIVCGSFCEASYSSGTSVTLNAVPDAGAAFEAWTGACAGQGATCTVTVTLPVSTNAVFELAPSGSTTTGTTTSTGPTTSTTTPTSTSTTTPTSTPTPAPKPFSVQLVGAVSARSRLGFRVERVEILTATTVSATLTLTRKGRRLSFATLRGIPPGDRVLTLAVPSAVAPGEATLHLTVTGASGKSRRFAQTVRLRP